MKLFHDVYTMTLERASILFKTKDINYIKKIPIWMPKKIVQKAYELFMNEHLELFNHKQQDDLFDSKARLGFLYNRIQLYQAIKYGIIYTADKSLIDEFEQMYSFRPKTISDLDRLDLDINQLMKYYKEEENKVNNIIEESKKSKNQDYNFEKVIIITGKILDQAIDRQLKIFQFCELYKEAEEIARKALTKTNK